MAAFVSQHKSHGNPGDFHDVSQVPRAVIDRLRHYFLTYKAIPGETPARISVDPVYGAADARAILRASREDYDAKFAVVPTVEG